MSKFEDFVKEADENVLHHTIKILLDSGLDKEEIIRELELTENEYNKALLAVD